MDEISAVLFDFDDTLMATRDRRYDALIETGRELDAKISSEKIDYHWGKPFDELVNKIAPDVAYDEFYAHYKSVMKEHQPKVQPGARETLNLLQTKSIPVFVVSSGSRDLIRQDLQEGELWRYVTCLWGYEDTPAHKPDPNTLFPVLQHLKFLDINDSATLFIGDSLRDLKVARGNELTFRAVLTGLANRSDFRSEGLANNKILDSLNSLLTADSEFLKAIEQ